VFNNNFCVSKDKSEAYKQFADKLYNVQEVDKQKRKTTLKEGIDSREELLANSSKSTLIQNQISKISEQAGYSAFTDVSGKINSPKLRRSKFIELLSREILLIGLEQLEISSKVCTLEALENYFETNRTNWVLRKNDIIEAVKHLHKNQLIPKFVESDEGVLIYFRPIELNDDVQKLLIVSSGLSNPKIDMLVSVTGWEKQRLLNALEFLQKNGLVAIDEESVYFLNFTK
jgi:hypothetical protein